MAAGYSKSYNWLLAGMALQQGRNCSQRESTRAAASALLLLPHYSSSRNKFTQVAAVDLYRALFTLL